MWGWMRAAVFAVPIVAGAASADRSRDRIEIDWTQVIAKSKTEASLQVVVNPLLRRGSVIHDQAFSVLKDLQANKVRFVPWMPYPRLGVAELEPPTSSATSWDFSLIDPLVDDFMGATEGKERLLNFSTIPQWLFKTSWQVTYPDNPDEEDWSYEQGTDLRDPSLKELQNYYVRLYQWYTQGGFTDELGQWRNSGHTYDVPLWEVFNEPDAEHATTPQQYTQRYDAIVNGLRKVNPKLQFMGPGLEQPMSRMDYFNYFLNPANHAAGTPIDWVSYHFYAVVGKGEPIESQEKSLFSQCDMFLWNVGEIEKVRWQFSPTTKTAINEVGTIMADDYSRGFHGIDDRYWNISAAVYAYLVGQLTLMGIDLVSESQLVGFPGQFPSVSMVDWNTGDANARYWVLKLLLANMSMGDTIVHSDNLANGIFTLAFTKTDGSKKIFVVNKKLAGVAQNIAGIKNASIDYVSPGVVGIAHGELVADNVQLNGFGVAVITLK